jgi:hypothetical protein
MEINFNDCVFNKKTKTLLLGNFEARFPNEFKVRSNRTGKVVRFVQDIEAAMRNEFWDGMMMEYKPTEACGVECLAVSPMEP